MTQELMVIAEHRIHDNAGKNFSITDQIHPETGEYKIKAEARITNPGEWVSLPVEIAAELLESGAAREPTEIEWQLRRIATGELVQAK